MKTLHVLFILGWLFIGANTPIKANDTIKTYRSLAIEIGFKPNITAPDLEIKRLTKRLHFIYIGVCEPKGQVFIIL